MEVLFVTKYNKDNLDGSGKRFKRYVNLFEESYKTQYIQLPSSILKRLLISFLVVLKRKRTTIICFADYFSYIGLLLGNIFRSNKIIFSAEGLNFHESKERGKNKLYVFLIKMSEKLIGLTSSAVMCASSNILEFYVKYNTKSFVINNFLEVPLDLTNKDSIYSKYQIPINKKTIGLIGPFNNEFNKNYPEFIFNNLDKFDVEINFVFIGAFDLNIVNDRLLFVGKVIDENDYFSLIAAFDLLVVPSIVATSGQLTKIIEAFACKTLVCTTNQGLIGFDAYVVENCVLCSNIDALPLLIQKNICDNNSTGHIIDNAYNYYLQNFSKNSQQKKIQQVFFN